jgi:FixJ family two-component response regulator
MKKDYTAGVGEHVTIEQLKLLNQKEAEVLSLMVKGFNSRESCTMLNLKSRQLEMHRYNIKKKLKLRSHKAVVSTVVRFYDSHIMNKNVLPDETFFHSLEKV